MHWKIDIIVIKMGIKIVPPIPTSDHEAHGSQPSRLVGFLGCSYGPHMQTAIGLDGDLQVRR